ncbi:MAG: OFA family MFS transporter [Ruminococcaceae bacterium]|nr:OFA family MFS transporter [Oscillospiraceae bacterium]
MFSDKKLSNRNIFLITGLVSMLFAGVIYAWSILKAPFKNELSFADSDLALCFTFTMCTFCIGAFIGSKLLKKIGIKFTVMGAGLLSGMGFFLTGLINPLSIELLYVFYALFAGLGIGIAYNVIISAVNSWFPDKKGFSSGVLLMGFGASTLILGNVIDIMFASSNIGYKNTFMIFGVLIALVLIIAALIIKLPSKEVKFPEVNKNVAKVKEDFEMKDYTAKEMLKRFTFWRAFILLVFLTAVGNSVISFAKDLVISIGAIDSLATTLVGVLAVCNGIGRVITGIVFDRAGRKTTMIFSNLLTICASAVTLLAVIISSLPLGIIGLCLVGLSYGSCPTVCSAFVSAFYGQKYFPTNFSIINFNLIFASFIASLSSTLFTLSGGYVVPFIMLLSLSVISLGLNLSIKKP